jgi:hypothetical protein
MARRWTLRLDLVRAPGAKAASRALAGAAAAYRPIRRIDRIREPPRFAGKDAASGGQAPARCLIDERSLSQNQFDCQWASDRPRQVRAGRTIQPVM